MDCLLGEGMAVSPALLGEKRRLAYIRAKKYNTDCLNTAISVRTEEKNHLDCLNTAVSQS